MCFFSYASQSFSWDFRRANKKCLIQQWKIAFFNTTFDAIYFVCLRKLIEQWEGKWSFLPRGLLSHRRHWTCAQKKKFPPHVENYSVGAFFIICRTRGSASQILGTRYKISREKKFKKNFTFFRVHEADLLNSSKLLLACVHGLPKLPGSYSHTQAVLQTVTLFYIHCGINST
jgi:hypothetical protein